MRMAANLILSLRAMGLHHMLAMAPERGTCDALWITMPTLACVWWPSQFARKRPSSLYNDMFSRTALAFFEARKLLLMTDVDGVLSADPRQVPDAFSLPRLTVRLYALLRELHKSL